MDNIKMVTITLALLTTSAFPDFTIKDLFVSGGTKTVSESVKSDDDSKNKHNKKTHEDCQ